MERKAKILIYDIETSPIIGYTWGVWQTDVVQVLNDWQILTVAWKWYGEKKVHCIGQDDFSDYKAGVNNDYEVVKKLRDLLDEADIVIAHNGNSFDQKKTQTRIVIHDIEPPSPYKQIDTKLVAKRYFKFTRNNLKYLAQDLNVEQKGESGGMETWHGCLQGDKKAWKQMKKYNKQDIPPLEDLYVKFLPWISNHPNMARLTNKHNVCPNCESVNVQKRGYRVTNVSKFRRFQCQDCAHWFSGRLAEKADVDLKPQFTNYS